VIRYMSKLFKSPSPGLLLGSAAAGLLAGMAAVNEQARVDLRNLKTALTMFRELNGDYPSTAQGIKGLVERPTAPPKPKMWRKLLAHEIRDPWKFEFVYKCPGEKNPDSYDLFSVGPDGKTGTPTTFGRSRSLFALAQGCHGIQ
jgi:general secretion pathway protein G